MKIGYTTGVFDLFHIGHLKVLKEASNNCDYLIVGVSTDELVMSYKNRKPIISYEDRSEIISYLQFVDKVVPQTDFSKVDAYHKYNFDILFHGDDWKGSSKYEEIENTLKSFGVEFVYFPYTKGVSTSLIKTKIYELLDIMK